MRLLDDSGKVLGVFPLLDANRMAQEKNLDLIIVSEKANPPVARMGDLGRYLYEKEKKERVIRAKNKPKEIKEVQISIREGRHDMERKANQISEFLKEGHQVQVRLALRGRERQNKDFAKTKFDEFLSLIQEPFKEDSKRASPAIILAILTKR